jgi:hypothetical protein
MTIETAANPAETNAGTGQQQAGGAGTEGKGAPTGTLPEGTQPGAEGSKPEGGEKGEAAEVDYSFQMPEGIELDKASTDEFVAIAKELKLPKDAAQKVVDLAVRREQQRMETHRTTVAEWADQVKADKELGGDKLQETLAIAGKAIDLGPPELKQLLNNSGVGNHPAVVRWAYNIGKALSEDRFVAGKAADKPTSTASRLFPDMNP